MMGVVISNVNIIEVEKEATRVFWNWKKLYWIQSSFSVDPIESSAADFSLINTKQKNDGHSAGRALN